MTTSLIRGLPRREIWTHGPVHSTLPFVADLLMPCDSALAQTPTTGWPALRRTSLIGTWSTIE